MQDEHERPQDPEEGEYHFSDEGIYETHSEEEEEGKAAPTLSDKAGLKAQFSSYKRFVILGGIFAGVLLVVYLVIAPPTTPPPTEITEAVTPVTPPVAPSKMAAVAPKASAPEVAKPAPVAVATAPTLPPPIAQPAAAPAQANLNSLANMQQEVAKAAAAMPVSPALLAPAPAPAPEPLAAPQQPGPMGDRLAAIEESNSKLISQLNAEYARKLAEFEVQDRALQEQIKVLTTKLSGMEAQMNQLVHALTTKPTVASESPPSNINNVSESTTVPVVVMPASNQNFSAGPKSNYSVQAIIPGRAWLRTEGGETVTVAEGDVLKGMGRVAKIDPYDGTIQIDTGSKMIMLTYGNGDYA